MYANFWNYIENRLLPALYPTNISSIGLINNTYNITIIPGVIAEGAGYLLGARLRQLRMQFQSCPVSDIMKMYFTTCVEDYSYYYSDTADYNAGWISNNDKVANLVNTTASLYSDKFKYQSPIQLAGVP